MRTTLLLSALALASAGSNWPPAAYTSAKAILSKMNLTHKIAMVHGSGGSYVGDTPTIVLPDGTTIPAIHEHDGPQGVGNGNRDVTAWPAALTVVMTWDTELMYSYGAAMGKEQYGKGSNVMLGPGVNLARLPWNGRNFEYQGEDPHLAAIMCATEIKGIQSQNVSACVKHYVFNNEETDRSGMSANVPDRAAKELYYKPFLAAVDAGVGSAMCSYNRVNGTWACEDANSLNEIKTIGGFDGWMMSDWGATHSTVPAALAGLDQQMPDAGYFGAALQAAVIAGTVPESRLDDMILRMLTPMFALNLFTTAADPALRNTSSYVRSPEHDALAQTLARRSITLLKNEGGLLPVSPTNLRNVVVLGDENTVTGEGSGKVISPYIITPTAGITSYLNPNPPTGKCTQENDIDYYQATSLDIVSADTYQQCCDACARNPRCTALTLFSGQCYLKDSTAGRVVSNGRVSGNCTAVPPSVRDATVNVTYLSSQTLGPTEAAAVAAADLVVMVVATDSSEGSDRKTMGFPQWMDDLVGNLSATAGDKTVVVARCPGSCTMPWVGSVRSILFEMLAGQESGNSIAATLFGGNNPSGKLPLTFPNPAPPGSQYPTETWLSPVGGGPVIPTMFPGTDRGRGFPEADYSEGLLMGYRWYDAQNIAPAFPFGHGLSYSTFQYSALSVSPPALTPSTGITVYATLCNTGGPGGEEVAQLYLGFPAAADMPPKQLKGFQKVYLGAGACEGVGFPIDPKDVQIWDVVAQVWKWVPGTYSVWVGSSSRDIRLTGSFTI